MNIVLLGVLCFGGLVGYLLGIAWKKSKRGGVRAAIALIGAAFTGVPIAYLSSLGDERWMYPIGVLAGFFWSRIDLVTRVLRKGPQEVGRYAWGLALIEGALVILVSIALFAIAVNSEFGGSDLNSDQKVVELTSKEMPCRLAWIFLEKYSNANNKYLVPPAFSYPKSSAPRSPLPSVGDEIVITKERNLIITGYGSSGSVDRCARMLEPPAGYTPATAPQYVAGRIQPGRSVLVNEVVYLPSRESEPTYVWVLIGPR